MSLLTRSVRSTGPTERVAVCPRAVRDRTETFANRGETVTDCTETVVDCTRMVVQPRGSGSPTESIHTPDHTEPVGDCSDAVTDWPHRLTD
jgi:hypothetical protein